MTNPPSVSELSIKIFADGADLGDFIKHQYDRKVAEIIRRAILVVRPAVQRLFQRHENALNLCHSDRARVGCSEFD